MKNYLIPLLLLLVFPLLSKATVEPAETLTLTVNSDGEVVAIEDQQAVSTWTSGPLLTNYFQCT